MPTCVSWQTRCGRVTSSLAIIHNVNPFDQRTFYDRMFGQYWGYSLMIFTCNVFIPLLLFSKAIRTSLTSLFVTSIFVNIGI